MSLDDCCYDGVKKGCEFDGSYNGIGFCRKFKKN